jgi:hypothetical protein
LPEGRAARSRMHILDWLDGGTFIPSINAMLRLTELFVPQSGKRTPKGWDNTDEARLGKECEALVDESLNAILREWWLIHVKGANIPNWDLICEALYQGNKPALVLVEAKAYAWFADCECRKRPFKIRCSPTICRNHVCPNSSVHLHYLEWLTRREK